MSDALLIQALRDRIYDLEDQVRKLSPKYDVCVEMVKRLRITPQQAKMLDVLMRRQWVSMEQMYAILEADRSLSANYPNTVMCYMRKALARFNIKIPMYVRGVGWSLSAEVKQQIIKLLEDPNEPKLTKYQLIHLHGPTLRNLRHNSG